MNKKDVNPKLKIPKSKKNKYSLKQKKPSLKHDKVIKTINVPTRSRKNLSVKKTKRKQTQNFEIKKILVAVSDLRSKKVLNTAIYFAKKLDAAITILKVISDIPLINTSEIKKLKNTMISDTMTMLETAKQYCVKENISATSKIGRGDESDVIIKTSIGHDMIIIGSHGKGIASELFFGSISNKVSHKSKLPVLLVKFE